MAGVPMVVGQTGVPVQITNPQDISEENFTAYLKAKLNSFDQWGNTGMRIFGGRMGTLSNATPKTYHVTTALAQDFDAIQIVFGNISTTEAINSITAQASVLSDASDLNNSNGTWVNVLVNNRPGFSVPISPRSNRINYFVTDPVPLKSIPRTDSGTLPLVAVRAYVSNTVNLSVYGNGSDNFQNWATRPDGKIWAARHQDGNRIGTPATFTDTTNRNQSPIIGIIYLSQGKVVSVGGCGDSITMGISEYLGASYGLKLAADLSDRAGLAVEWANFGWASQNSVTYLKRAIDVLNSPVCPDILIMPTGSPNDISTTLVDNVSVNLITPALIQNQAAFLQAAIKKAKEKNVKILLWTWLPTNVNQKVYGATDALRVAENNRYMSLVSRDFLVVDASNALSGGLINGQMQLAGGTTDDGIHLNNVGSDIHAEIIETGVRKLIGRI